jgi:hypothetical protein
MVKFINILWLLFVVNLICCNASQVKQKNTDFKKISEYFDLNVVSNQDTVIIGNEIAITITFKNRTDTNFYFHPEALLYMDRYIAQNIFVAGEDLSAHYFSLYDDMSKLVLIEAHENYSETYNVIVRNPLFCLGKNKLVIKYLCSSYIRNNEQKREHEILYGGLENSTFEIFVKEK